MKDPNAAAARWSQNLSAAGPKITEGVNAVQTAPGQLAARQKAVYLANVTAKVDVWARAVAAVPLEEWRRSMIDKGVNRIATGAQGAQQKMATFLTSFLPHVDAGVRALPPRGNLEANIGRMVAMVRHNAAYASRRPGA